MINVPINHTAAHALIDLKLNDKMSSAFMSYICFDGKNIQIEQEQVNELKQIATIVNDILINYNDQVIHTNNKLINT